MNHSDFIRQATREAEQNARARGQGRMLDKLIKKEQSETGPVNDPLKQKGELKP